MVELSVGAIAKCLFDKRSILPGFWLSPAECSLFASSRKFRPILHTLPGFASTRKRVRCCMPLNGLKYKLHTPSACNCPDQGIQKLYFASLVKPGVFYTQAQKKKSDVS